MIINKRNQVWEREWQPGDVVRHFKGKTYIIICVGLYTETSEDMIVYQGEDDRIWIRPREMFESRVDKNKYPYAKQEWRFEKVEEQ